MKEIIWYIDSYIRRASSFKSKIKFYIICLHLCTYSLHSLHSLHSLEMYSWMYDIHLYVYTRKLRQQDNIDGSIKRCLKAMRSKGTWLSPKFFSPIITWKVFIIYFHTHPSGWHFWFSLCKAAHVGKEENDLRPSIPKQNKIKEVKKLSESRFMLFLQA